MIISKYETQTQGRPKIPPAKKSITDILEVRGKIRKLGGETKLPFFQGQIKCIKPIKQSNKCVDV